jgi:hypothetical protein
MIKINDTPWVDPLENVPLQVLPAQIWKFVEIGVVSGGLEYVNSCSFSKRDGFFRD